MSAFGGVLYKDRDRPVEQSVLSSLASSLRALGPDGNRTHVAGPIGFTYHSLHTTAESHQENQPHYDHGLVILFDGRIDNRDELCSMLHLVPEQTTDLQIVVASFRLWRYECFRRLIGDFAIAIWDSATHELILARDPFAIRKLFYCDTAECLFWATDISALLNCPGVSDSIDESFVGLSLAYLPDGTTSPFRDIRPVRAGQYHVFSDRSRTTEYWGIAACVGSYPSDTHYLEDRLRDLVFSAVTATLRSDRPVTAELSGGLDSSTIVCVADAVCAKSHGAIPKVDTLSFVYDLAGQSDERNFIALVEEQRGRPGIHIREDDDPILSRWPDPQFTSYPNRLHCFGGAVDQTIDSMEQRNSRVLLSGLYGDQLFVSSNLLPYEAADLCRSGDYGSAVRTCQLWSLAKRQPFVSIFWHAAVRPNLPSWMRRSQSHSGQGPRVSASHFRMPSWIEPEFSRKTHLQERIRLLVNRDAKFKAGSRGLRYANLMECVGWFGSGYGENHTSRRSVEMRYPYLYRPLVEFLISVPYRELCNERTVRRLQRSAMRDILPEQIRLRTDKKGPQEAIVLAIVRQWRSLLLLIEESRACELGYVSKPAILAEANRWRNGQTVSDMFKFVALEMWLRALESRKTAS